VSETASRGDAERFFANVRGCPASSGSLSKSAVILRSGTYVKALHSVFWSQLLPRHTLARWQSESSAKASVSYRQEAASCLKTTVIAKHIAVVDHTNSAPWGGDTQGQRPEAVGASADAFWDCRTSNKLESECLSSSYAIASKLKTRLATMQHPTFSAARRLREVEGTESRTSIL
jgi:hypothetical protein